MRLAITPALVITAIPRGVLGQYASADMMRFQCSRLIVERVDLLANTGLVQSTHIHQNVGGNSFNATMPPVAYDPSRESTCTTCDYSEDFSNYWTAVLFFKHPNGTYKRVPIMQNTALPNGINGGMTIYYTQQDFFSNGNQKITAFPKVRGTRPAVGDLPARLLTRGDDRASV